MAVLSGASLSHEEAQIVIRQALPLRIARTLYLLILNAKPLGTFAGIAVGAIAYRS
jgi:hypothetical protein